MKDQIGRATNKRQKAHRIGLYNRFIGYKKQCTRNGKLDEGLLWELMLPDYAVFTSVFFKNKYGQVFFPSEWQIEATENINTPQFTEAFFFACRRSGKSSWASTFIIWKMAVTPYTIVTMFAPTDKQLYIINYIYDNLMASEFLQNKLIAKPIRSHLKKRAMKYLNGSEVETQSMGRGYTGDSARGGGGNLLVIEEIGLWNKDDLNSVVKPMKRETHGDKIVLVIGTPYLKDNPDLPLEWRRAQELDHIYERGFTCWDALREGIRDVPLMKEMFYDYAIECKIGKETGLCPKYVPDYFDPPPPDDWSCPYGELCMDNDDYVREELIGFPKLSGALFTHELVAQMFPDGMRIPAYGMIPGAEAENKVYIMAADTALLMDYTQILVGELTSIIDEYNQRIPAVKIVYWREINPEEIEASDPQPIVDAFKEVYKAFQPKWVLADASAMGGVINNLCTKGKDAIPMRRFVQNSTAKAKDVPGLIWHGEFKDQMFKNLKTQIMKGAFIAPHVQPFAKKIVEELTGLEAKPVQTGRYNTITARKGKKKDLASAAAMLAWPLHDSMNIRTSKHFGVATGRGDPAPIGTGGRAPPDAKYAGLSPFEYPPGNKVKTTSKLGGTSLGMAKGRKKRGR